MLPPVPGCLTFTFHLEPAPGQTSEMECYDYVVPPFAGRPMHMPSSGSAGYAAAAAFPSVRMSCDIAGTARALMSEARLVCLSILADVAAAVAFLRLCCTVRMVQCVRRDTMQGSRLVPPLAALLRRDWPRRSSRLATLQCRQPAAARSSSSPSSHRRAVACHPHGLGPLLRHTRCLAVFASQPVPGGLDLSSASPIVFAACKSDG